MPRRLVPLLMALAVVATACGQATPERGTLPDVPDAFVFTTTTTTTLDPVPDDGSCYLVQSLGARVSSLEPGYDAANQLEQGDIITAIDGKLVTSQETLVSTLAAYAPTDVVEVLFDRAGNQLSADVELGALPDDASRPRLGVVAVPQIAATQPAGLSLEGTPPPSSHFAVAENRLYRMDPLAGLWFDTGLEDPQTSIIVFNDTIYTQDIGGRPVLSPLEGGADLVIPTQGRNLLRALTTVGDVFVASVGIVSIAEDPTEPAELEIIGVDLDSGTLEWRWMPRDEAGVHGTPLFAFRSPDGNEASSTVKVSGHNTDCSRSVLDTASRSSLPIPRITKLRIGYSELATFASRLDTARPGAPSKATWLMTVSWLPKLVTNGSPPIDASSSDW